MPDKARLLALVAVTEGSTGTATKSSIEEYDQVNIWKEYLLGVKEEISIRSKSRNIYEE